MHLAAHIARPRVFVRPTDAAFSGPRCLCAALVRAICAAFLGTRRQVWLMRAICTAFLGPLRQVWPMRAICTAFLGPRREIWLMRAI